MPPSDRPRIGQVLMAAGILDAEQLQTALGTQAATEGHQRLGQAILDLGYCTEAELTEALSEQLGVPAVDLSQEAPDPGALERVPRRLARRHRVLPLRVENGNLVVAMADPTDVVARDDLELTAGVGDLDVLVASETQIAQGLRRSYGADGAARAALDELDEDRIELPDVLDQLDAGSGEDGPVIRLANAILEEAVRLRASDVHIEPGRHELRVRYRVDGMLRESMRAPRRIMPALASRIKVMASLDIAERRRPQDGRARLRVDGQDVDLRISTMPSMHGETIVLRLLQKGQERLLLDDLGLSPDIRSTFERILERPQGLIVITGPTGSGKTTTLYAALTEIADPVRNIVTLEDPIEYELPGVNQTQINPKAGLTFAGGMRSMLRQDPDVVMVGEIRDDETAELALEASMTGHLVLATLHTNDAPSTVVRLLDLGVDRFLIASSLALVAAQRLARTVCPSCAEPAEPEERSMRLLGLAEADLEGADLRRGTGCQECDKSGFRGRTAIIEALPVTPAMRELIMEGGTETDIARLARDEGMRTLRHNGIEKAKQGITTLREVLRVTPEEPVSTSRCPSCHLLVGDDFVICPSCREPLSQATTCPYCQHRVEADWSACPFCRAELTGVTSPPPAAEQA